MVQVYSERPARVSSTPSRIARMVAMMGCRIKRNANGPCSRAINWSQNRLRISRISDMSVSLFRSGAARRIEYDLIVPPELLEEGPYHVERCSCSFHYLANTPAPIDG